ALPGAEIAVIDRMASQEDVRERAGPARARRRERRHVACAQAVPTAGNIGWSQLDRKRRAVGNIDRASDRARGVLEDDPWLVIRVDRPGVPGSGRLQTIRASRGPTRRIEKRI